MIGHIVVTPRWAWPKTQPFCYKGDLDCVNPNHMLSIPPPSPEERQALYELTRVYYDGER